VTNDPRNVLAVGMLTAVVNGDEEGFYEITSAYEGGCPEALMASTRVSQSILAMFAEAAGVSVEEMLVWVASRISLGD
jgi:hypothetical protein